MEFVIPTDGTDDYDKTLLVHIVDSYRTIKITVFRPAPNVTKDTYGKIHYHYFQVTYQITSSDWPSYTVASTLCWLPLIFDRCNLTRLHHSFYSCWCLSRIILWSLYRPLITLVDVIYCSQNRKPSITTLPVRRRWQLSVHCWRFFALL
jgi:hypothetical protein